MKQWCVYILKCKDSTLYTGMTDEQIDAEIKPLVDEGYAKAKEILGWQAEYDMVDMCRDAWNWQRQNPQGY